MPPLYRSPPHSSPEGRSLHHQRAASSTHTALHEAITGPARIFPSSDPSPRRMGHFKATESEARRRGVRRGNPAESGRDSEITASTSGARDSV